MVLKFETSKKLVLWIQKEYNYKEEKDLYVDMDELIVYTGNDAKRIIPKVICKNS